MTASDVLPPVVVSLFAEMTGAHAQSDWPGQAVGLLMFYAVFGIPIALVVTIVVGAITWRIADKDGTAGARAALRTGAAVGAVLGLVSLIGTLVQGLRTQADDSFRYDAWRYGWQVERDGMPTPFGWLLELAELPVTVGIGAAVGWVAWRAARRRS